MAGIVALRRQRATVPAGGPMLAELVRTADELTETARTLPVLPALRPLLPGGGLRRGSIVAVSPGSSVLDSTDATTAGLGGTSVLLALLVAASRSGSWCAVVGVPALGAAAAAELGVDLDRLALVPNPGPEWAAVVAALLDGIDIVVAASAGPVAPHIASRLAARTRKRGSVLVPYGRWDGADVTLEPIRAEWHGLDRGRGRLRSRQLTVVARGRGAAARPRQARVWLPAPSVGSGPALAQHAADRPLSLVPGGLPEVVANPPALEAV
jgi:hypothetical protein